MSIFDYKAEVKPYTYPHLLDFMRAIRKSYWVIDEFNFAQDVQDFKVSLTEEEREIVKKSVISISNIENSVKTFWGRVYDNLPKPEIAMVGYTFADSEVRHQEAYSELLTVLGFNNDFEQSLQEPVLKGRVEYLQKYLKNAGDNSQQRYALNISLFGLFIERVSLFSQFAIIKSFEKHRNKLSEISNVIEATRAEELIHHKFAVEIINIIREENPEWFNEDFNNTIYRACKKAFEAEKNILDWIFQESDLDFCSKESLIEYIKYTFNSCLEDLKLEPIFEIDEDVLHPLRWFINEEHAYNRNDFFVSMSNNYNKFRQVSPFNILKKLKEIQTNEQLALGK